VASSRSRKSRKDLYDINVSYPMRMALEIRPKGAHLPHLSAGRKIAQA